MKQTDSVDKFQHESSDVQIASHSNRILDVHVRNEDSQIPRAIRRHRCSFTYTALN